MEYRWRERLSKTLKKMVLGAIFCSGAAGVADAEQVKIVGTLGYLSEWEVKGVLNTENKSGSEQLTGAVTLRHVGICGQEGPEEKIGQLQYRIVRAVRPRMEAVLTLDGTECGFSAKISSTYEGALSCARWNGVPVRLSILPVE